SRKAFYATAKQVLSQHDPIPDAMLPIKVLVNGTALPVPIPFSLTGHVMAALAPIKALVGWNLIATQKDQAVIKDTKGSSHQIPLQIIDETGYVALKDLPGTVVWDGDSRTASFTPAA